MTETLVKQDIEEQDALVGTVRRLAENKVLTDVDPNSICERG
jgi:hypothetical protein